MAAAEQAREGGGRATEPGAVPATKPAMSKKLMSLKFMQRSRAKAPASARDVAADTALPQQDVEHVRSSSADARARGTRAFSPCARVWVRACEGSVRMSGGEFEGNGCRESRQYHSTYTWRTLGSQSGTGSRAGQCRGRHFT